jgi:hypothetical protein
MKPRHSPSNSSSGALDALAYAFDFRKPSDLARLGPYYAILKTVFDTVHGGIWQVESELSSDWPKFRTNSFWLGALFLDLYLFLPVYALWTIPKLFEIALRRTRRPTYYGRENARRRELAKERRRVHRRTTVNRAPTPDELRAQWARVRKSPRDMLVFGSMLEDLEAYVDNSLVRNEYGEIVGRNGGIKKWLADNCPELWAKYPSVMRFKALAKKFKQAVGLEDPYPITVALGPTDSVASREAEDAENHVEDTQEGDVILRCGQNNGRRKEARGEARDLMAACTRTERSLRAALEERLGPVAEPLVCGAARRMGIA